MNKRAGVTAADVVNTYEESRLADIFYLYGELKTVKATQYLTAMTAATESDIHVDASRADIETVYTLVQKHWNMVHSCSVI